jgi:hypothetical protein
MRRTIVIITAKILRDRFHSSARIGGGEGRPGHVHVGCMLFNFSGKDARQGEDVSQVGEEHSTVFVSVKEGAGVCIAVDDVAVRGWVRLGLCNAAPSAQMSDMARLFTRASQLHMLLTKRLQNDKYRQQHTLCQSSSEYLVDDLMRCRLLAGFIRKPENPPLRRMVGNRMGLKL